MKIITNNHRVVNEITDYPVEFVQGNYRDVLLTVHRAIVEEHQVMLTHPLSGSIKPNETVYKSIIVTNQKEKNIHMDSINMIDHAIDVYDDFQSMKATPDWPEKILQDFAMVDFHIIQGALSQIQIPPRYL